MAVSVIKSDSKAYTILNDYIRYEKRDGIMQVRMGTANSLTLTRDGVELGTLPAGCRPVQQLDFGGSSLGGTNVVFFRVETSGVIKGYANPNTAYWTGTCMFIAH